MKYIYFNIAGFLILFFKIVASNQNLTTATEKSVVLYMLNNEKKLINDLFKNYQVKFGRPVNNMTESVVVYFELFLIQLIDLDERNQVLITNVQTQYRWKDNGLKWNKDTYGGIDDIRLPVNRIWTPDIVLYNYADTRLEEKRDVMAIVSSDGTVRWRPPSIFKSTCQINIQNFPYDYQNCSMKFGSWTYDRDSIDIQFLEKQEINRELYIQSNEWDIISADGKRNEKKYECCKEVYPDITYHIKMARKGGFYNYILVLPCVLLSCLTIVLFWLPPESPAKMVLGMNIFTSFFVLLLLLSKNVPSATDKIPLIGAYYCLNMIMIATSTCSCTVVVHIYFRGQGQIPFLLRKIFLEFLARIFCMITPPILPPAHASAAAAAAAAALSMTQNNLNTPGKQSTLQKQQPLASTVITSLNNNQLNQSLNNNLVHQVNKIPVLPIASNRLTAQQLNSISCSALNEDGVQLVPKNSLPIQDMSVGFGTLTPQARSSSYYQAQQLQQPPQQQQHYHTHQQSNQLNNELSLSFNLIENDIKEIRDYLRHTRKKLETTDSKTKQTNEWKQVALVLDRTLFFMYIIAIIVSSTIMMTR